MKEVEELFYLLMENMRKQIKTTDAIFPMPVLLVATYNEDNSINEDYLDKS